MYGLGMLQSTRDLLLYPTRGISVHPTRGICWYPTSASLLYPTRGVLYPPSEGVLSGGRGRFWDERGEGWHVPGFVRLLYRFPVHDVCSVQLRMMRSPKGVNTDSGWNWMPCTSSVRWRRPMMRPSSLTAVMASVSGRPSRLTTHEW